MRKLAILLVLGFLSLRCFGATITREVNTGSAGGNGTTTALSGPNAAYASLSAWNAAEAQDLTDNGGDVMVVNCAGTAADTTGVTLSGWTTGSTNYIEIVGNNTTGILDTSKYRMEVSTVIYCLRVVNAGSDFVRVRNMQFKNTNADGDCVEFDRAQAATYDHRVSNCILYGGVYGLYLGRTTVKAWNNVIYGMSTVGIWCLSGYAAPTAELYNNTIINSVRGINAQSGTVTSKNNYAGGNTTGDYLGTFTSSSTHASSDATGNTGLQNIAVSTSAGAYFTNVTGGSENLHINTSSALIDVGTSDPGSGLFSDDLDGVARTGSWDIGADEFVAAGGGGGGDARRVILVE